MRLTRRYFLQSSGALIAGACWIAAASVGGCSDSDGGGTVGPEGFFAKP